MSETVTMAIAIWNETRAELKAAIAEKQAVQASNVAQGYEIIELGKIIVRMGDEMREMQRQNRKLQVDISEAF